MLMDQGVLGEHKFSGKQRLLTSIEGEAGDARRKVRQVEAMAWLCVLTQPLPPRGWGGGWGEGREQEPCSRHFACVGRREGPGKKPLAGGTGDEGIRSVRKL